jgi:2-polyprenyl-3-methyl-5-hydroxy-6-metoxy-1,4-benzoquinol methylase
MQKKKGVQCTFIKANFLENTNQIQEKFDFAYDWEVLHHVFREHRHSYVKNLNKILNPDAKYMSVSK